MRRSFLVRSVLFLTLALSMAGCSAHMGVVIRDDPPPGGGDKTSVCHKGKTLDVAEAALDAHLRHGDTPGPCR